MKNGNTVCLALSLLASASASAESVRERGGYAGVSLGAAFLGETDFVTRDVADDFVSVNGERDDSDFAWQIYGGYRLLKYFALEARYTDFGSYEAALRAQVVGIDIDGNSTVEIVAVSAHAIGIYPFGGSGVDIYGQLGIGMGAYENQLRTTVLKIHVDDSPTMLSAGAGIRYTPPHFQPLTILLGYDWYGFDVDQSLIEESLDQSLSHVKLGAQYNF